MAIDSSQKAILDNIVTTLKTIDGTGNYNHNLGSNVWRTFRRYDQLPDDDFPCAMVIDVGTTTITPLTANEYTMGGSQLSVIDAWPIMVIGLVKITAQDIDLSGDLQDELIDLYSDITIAMHVDRRRGSNAESTSLIGLEKDSDWERMIGAIALTFAIKYDFNPTAGTPTT